MSDRRQAASSSARDGLPSREEVARALEEFQAGTDRKGNFHILHRFYHRRVERFLARRVFSPEERLDLNQEVFLRIYQNLDGFRGEGSLDGWVVCIAQNVYRKWRDRQSGGKSAGPETVSLEARPRRVETAARESSPLSPDPPSSPLEDLLGREQAEMLRSAMDELPRQMHRVLEMYVFEERSTREIAELLRIALGTVKAHLFKARKELRKKLQRQLDGLDFPIDEAET